MQIVVEVKNKRAISPHEKIVCGNSGYEIKFAFDDEWTPYEVKTARFIYNGEFVDVVFEGDVCAVPVMRNTTMCAVGVYAGDLRTTTPALIGCEKSILCSNPEGHEPPEPDVYNQIMELLNQQGTGGGAALPYVTTNDDGKILQVVGGKWAAAELPVFDGVYSVTPQTDTAQVLETAQKMMDANIRIEKIPYTETTNTANGTTVTIGGN